MKLYHGSLEIVEIPAIRESNRKLDFGRGFYTTTDFDQAKRWVEIRKRKEQTLVGFVNVYEVNEDILTNKALNILRFDSPNEAWIDFVVNNRTVPSFSHIFDLVYGPVANDNVYTALTLFESGFIDKTALIKEFKSYTLVDQILFHREISIQLLNYWKSIRI